MGARKILLGVTVSAALLGPAAAAQANTSASVNWSGYAVHHAGVKFRRVIGQWRQPSGTCTAGRQGFSAFWVGIGGFNVRSRALEQIGTEFDCTGAGAGVTSAWYELVPAPSRRIRMRVNPGDELRAQVVVAGSRVRLSLTDLTRHTSFTKTVTDRVTDRTSAEWITEAPSVCQSISQCRTLPLADFGSVGYSAASAQTAGFRTGSVSSAMWNRTRIVLASAGGARYVSAGGSGAQAKPSALTGGGHAFSVAYTGNPATASGSAAATGQPVARPRGALRRAAS